MTENLRMYMIKLLLVGMVSDLSSAVNIAEGTDYTSHQHIIIH